MLEPLMRPVASRAAAEGPLSRTQIATLRTALIRLALQHIGAEHRMIRSSSFALEATKSLPTPLHTAASAEKDAAKLLPCALAASQLRQASSKVGVGILRISSHSSCNDKSFKQSLGGGGGARWRAQMLENGVMGLTF